MSEQKTAHRRMSLFGLILMVGITVFACRLTGNVNSINRRGEASVANDAEPIRKPAAILNLTVFGIKQSTGSLKVAVFADGQGYPDHRQATQVKSFDVSQIEGSVTLDPLPPGSYAVAVYHDVDGDGNMNRAAVGYPTEPYGFSNDARATFGPPDYADAAFEAMDGAQDLSISIH